MYIIQYVLCVDVPLFTHMNCTYVCPKTPGTRASRKRLSLRKASHPAAATTVTATTTVTTTTTDGESSSRPSPSLPDGAGETKRRIIVLKQV